MRRTTTTLGGLVAVLLVLVAVTACSGDEPSAAPATTGLVPADDRVEADPGEVVTIDVLANDEGSGLRLARVAVAPTAGLAEITDAGQLRYRAGDDVALDALTYEVDADDGTSATAEVEIDVGDTTGAEETAIAWGPCVGADASAEERAVDEVRFAGMSCATVDVPLDHGDPGRGTTELFVARRPAPAAESIGPLFVNPGGPGISAVDQVGTVVANPRLDRFDVVAMDPRGVGRSTALDCGPVDLAWAEATVRSPDEPPTAVERDAAALAAACAGDPLTPFLSSNQTAADVDRLRELLGADQISYLGSSYGSDLGTAYASAYPQRLRAAVLDGATDLTLDLPAFKAQQVAAAEATWVAYLASCADAGCDWTGGAEPGAAWDALVARAEAGELVDVDSGEPITATALRAWTESISRGGFEIATEELDALVEDGVGDPFAVRFGPDDAALIVANIAITCADTPVADYPSAATRLLELAPGAAGDPLETLAACAAWPAADPIRVGPATGAGPILVLGARGDGATPYESGRGLAAVLEPATFLGWSGVVHTPYPYSRCVGDLADALLVDLVVPARTDDCDDAAGYWIGGLARPPVEPDLGDL